MQWMMTLKNHRGGNMTEFRTDKAIVRIHGNVERENVEKSTIKFVKEVMKCKNQRKKEASKTSY